MPKTKQRPKSTPADVFDVYSRAGRLQSQLDIAIASCDPDVRRCFEALRERLTRFHPSDYPTSALDQGVYFYEVWAILGSVRRILRVLEEPNKMARRYNRASEDDMYILPVATITRLNRIAVHCDAMLDEAESLLTTLTDNARRRKQPCPAKT